MESSTASATSGDSNTAGTSSRSNSRRGNRKHRHPTKTKSLPHLTALIFHPLFLGLFGLLVVALGISFWLVLVHPDSNAYNTRGRSSELQGNAEGAEDRVHVIHDAPDEALPDGPHLTPRLPHLPIFADIENAEQLMADTLEGRPTIAGIAVILNKFTEGKSFEWTLREHLL